MLMQILNRLDSKVDLLSTLAGLAAISYFVCGYFGLPRIISAFFFIVEVILCTIVLVSILWHFYNSYPRNQ